MNVHRALIALFACALLAGLIGCDTWPEHTYMGSRSERAMNNTRWEVSGEEKPQAPMPPDEPAPVPPHQAKAQQPAGADQNK